ncbi:hypothetical protein BDV23DRAFT_144928 [Aspergillus alliaceus]|uniref:Uncharacterized protein n=1 Tax=Petromyces alliaceus TaxID=209559 RepID=A0A5N7CP16_PETAA|nr:hypothetical protein BDV23DRAFT_144928 [Aspergillus alliaceus]
MSRVGCLLWSLSRQMHQSSSFAPKWPIVSAVRFVLTKMMARPWCVFGTKWLLPGATPLSWTGRWALSMVLFPSSVNRTYTH